MINLDSLDNLAHKLSQALPPSLKETKKDIEENFKVILQATFAKMNLVTREEFDRQTALLEKAREKLAALEKKLDELP
ncbi:MAG: hypothetical protein K0S08_1304 [Gammaproteobacteria bacterium]|jgi:BMFP domain-containing protein YqiC|nr:hypothetical protein [Gammaproteobacteria bacterium]